MRTTFYNEFDRKETCIEVCNYCGERVKHVGEDALSWCDNCRCVEGETKYITEEEYEKQWDTK